MVDSVRRALTRAGARVVGEHFEADVVLTLRVPEDRVDEVNRALGDATGEVPVLAGSGSTWFVPGAHPGPGRVVTRTVPAFDS